ncbi:MAG: hypothetical protein EXR59_04335 [Dehalococcoidia bacterium]|nr:hypothetical protein [Dehalococcoidia bacterium]
MSELILKPVRVALVGIACAAFMAACGGSDPVPTPTPTEEPTPTPKATPTPIPYTFNQFGFSLNLDGVYSVNTSPVLDPLPNEKSGSLLWAKGNATYVLSWRPKEDSKNEEERYNQRLVAIDRAMQFLQGFNLNVLTSEVSQPVRETNQGFSVIYKTFQIKTETIVSKGITVTFLCSETNKDFIIGIVFTDDTITAVTDTLSRFKCTKATS